MRRDATGNAGPLIPIGILARQTKCNVETIRFYEKIGILPKPRRTESGRRVYGQDLVQHLTFIRRARELGFSLNEIRSLLKLTNASDIPCSEAKDIAIAHTEVIEVKIADLRKMEKVLHTMIAKCEAGGDHSSCPLLETLYQPARIEESWYVWKIG